MRIATVSTPTCKAGTTNQRASRTGGTTNCQNTSSTSTSHSSPWYNTVTPGANTSSPHVLHVNEPYPSFTAKTCFPPAPSTASAILQPLIPGKWNAVCQYYFQPVVFINIEIISILLPPFGVRVLRTCLLSIDTFSSSPSCISSDSVGSKVALAWNEFLMSLEWIVRSRWPKDANRVVVDTVPQKGFTDDQRCTATTSSAGRGRRRWCAPRWHRSPG